MGHALQVRRAHPPSYISFDGLAVATHCSAPSSPLVEKVAGMERRQLSWQRGTLLRRTEITPINAGLLDPLGQSSYGYAQLFGYSLVAEALTEGDNNSPLLLLCHRLISYSTELNHIRTALWTWVDSYQPVYEPSAI
jgi:hypothetical protein